MGREFPERGSAGVVDNQLPDSFLVGDEFPHHPIALVLAFRNVRGLGPRVNPHLHRGGYRDSAKSVPFPHQVRNDPAAVALLDLVYLEADELGAAQSATRSKSARTARSRLPFNVAGIGRISRALR